MPAVRAYAPLTPRALSDKRKVNQLKMPMPAPAKYGDQRTLVKNGPALCWSSVCTYGDTSTAAAAPANRTVASAAMPIDRSRRSRCTASMNVPT